MERNRIQKTKHNLIINGKKVTSYKGTLLEQEELKQRVISNFAKEFMAEVEKLIAEKGKDYVMNLCTRD